MKKVINYENLRRFTYSNDELITGEVKGIISESNLKNDIAALASYSFGQTFNVTPLQLIRAHAACINGGYLYTPYVVEQVRRFVREFRGEQTLFFADPAMADRGVLYAGFDAAYVDAMRVLCRRAHVKSTVAENPDGFPVGENGLFKKLAHNFTLADCGPFRRRC